MYTEPLPRRRELSIEDLAEVASGCACIALRRTAHSLTRAYDEALRPSELRALADAIDANRAVNRWLYFWQVGRFMTNPHVRARTLRELWPQFVRSLPAFANLNRDLIPAVAAGTAREPELTGFDRPVRIIFGARDPYLNRAMARRFHQLLPTSDLFLLPARHYVQVDAPARVARLLSSIPINATRTPTHQADARARPLGSGAR